MADVEFWSEDHVFGLQIPTERLSRVLELSRTAAPEETGGILAGYYTDAHDCAVVMEASDAPPDSRSGRAFFVRGTTELQRWLNKLWRRERSFYLGDWHSHPGKEPRPSPTDLAQLKEIANDELCKCPEPILLLVGGQAANTRDVRVYVFPRNKGLIELYSTNL